MLIAVFRLVGERSVPVAVLLYLPRALWGLPAVPLLLVLARRRPRWAVALPLAAIVVTAGPLMGLHLSLPRTAEGGVRLLTYNVWFGYRDPAAIGEEVRAAQPDIVLFQAAAHAADVNLKAPPFEKYYYIHEASFVIASRWPARFVAGGESFSPRLGPAWVRFAVDSPIGTLDVFSVHPHSPRALFNRLRGGLRNLLRGAPPPGDADGTLPFLDRQLREIDAAVRGAGPLLIVAGDFNVPEGGALLNGRFTGTNDAFASAGNGYGYTFPALGRLPAWLRLDRVLLGPRLTALGARPVGGRGSDHLALLVRFDTVN